MSLQNEQTTPQSSGDMFTTRVSKQIAGKVAGRWSGGEQPEDATTDVEMPEGSLPYRIFCQRHPEYDLDYWNQLEAMYKGGHHLTRNAEVMKEIFPKHRNEHETVYVERKKRAFYVPYAGAIIDHIVAQLFTEPIEMEDEGEGDKERKVDDFWERFFKDCSPAGGERVKFNAFLKRMITKSLCCKTAWALVDLPDSLDDEGKPRYNSLAEQVDDGALDGWVVEQEPASVVDWDEDDAKELNWVLTYTMECRRGDLLSTRSKIKHCWYYYTRDWWQKFEYEHDRNKPPNSNTPIPLVAEGPLSFGHVPFVRLSVTDGLWAMAKLEGLAREHFNKRSGLAWGELQSLLPELYEYLNIPEQIAAVIGEDEADSQRRQRAFEQIRGQGHVQVRGSEDRAEFVGPSSDPFSQIRESCTDVRDEMHRVEHQMALSTDNSVAALSRSGDSKKQDRAATTVVLLELAKLVKGFATNVCRLLALGRGEAELAEERSASGMEKFDIVQLRDSLDDALSLEQVSIPSPTFQRKFKFQLAMHVLGDQATDKDKDAIKNEIDKNITDEEFDTPSLGELVAAAGGAKDDDDDDDDDDDKGKDKDKNADKGTEVKKPKVPPISGGNMNR